MGKFDLLKKNHAGLLLVTGHKTAINYGVIDILFHDEKKDSGILIYFNSKGMDTVKSTATNELAKKDILRMQEEKNYPWLIYQDYISILALENIERVMF